MIFSITDQIKNYIILGMVGVIILLGGMYWFSENAKEKCELKVSTVDALSEQAKKIQNEKKELYEEYVKSIVPIYNSKQVEIVKFERVKDETECEAAYRFFYNFDY